MARVRRRRAGKTVAVLFDMDDTVFDHVSTCERALRGSWEGSKSLQRKPFSEVAARYSQLLEEVYPDVLAGRSTHEEARDERFRRLFEFVNEPIDVTEAHHHSLTYRERYQRSRTVIPGAPELLRSLRERVTIGIVSNNHQEEQMDKLRTIGLIDLVDFVVTSELAGVAKPHPAIFSHALREASCRPEEAVMVGDNWVADIEGARSVGIRTVWFNRFDQTAPEAIGVPVLKSFVPLDAALETLLGDEG